MLMMCQNYACKKYVHQLFDEGELSFCMKSSDENIKTEFKRFLGIFN